MRTKLYLSALCLPLAFAACTNDEFENLANNTPIKGETVNVVLSAARPQLGADTKMTIDSENQFVWEAQKDLLGAALQSESTSDVTAFPFKADESARVSTFTGTSALPVGSYLFTYPYVDVLDQKVMPLNLSEQTYDPADAKTAIQQAVNYMKMISPMVTLEKGVAYADVEEYNLNLQFANLYTLVRVNISATNIPAGVEPEVTKVTLNSTTNEFVSKASADLTEIAKAGVLKLGKDGKLNQEEMAAAVAELEELIASGDIYNGKKKDGQGEDGSADTDSEKGPSVLKVKDGCKLSATAETSLYILAPKGDYTDLTLTVETSEGTYTRNMTFTTAPLTLGNNIQPISADLDFAQQDGNVVLPASISVASTADWDDAVDFVLAHATAYLNKTVVFNLTKDIAVDNLPNFNVNITGVKTLTLNKDYTITSNNVGNVSASTVTLGVGADATLTIDALTSTSTFPFAGVKNEGTLVVNVDMPSGAIITNLGTMNLSEDVELEGGVTNGQVAVPATGTPKVAGTINILDGETTINSAALENKVGDVKIAKGATLTIGFASTNNGTITNNGSLEGTVAITNAGGKIDNFGTLACAITNTNGQVIAEKGGLSNNTSTITGGELLVMDVIDFAAIKSAEAYKVAGSNEVVSTEINNAKEYTTAVGVTAINNVILNGGEWTVATAEGADNTKTIKVPTTTESVNITLKAASLVVNDVTSWQANITAGSGVCSISTDETSITIPGSVTVNEGATLNVTNTVSVNSTTDVSSYAATINGTLNVNAGAAMYFNTATVGRKGALNVAGSANNNVAAGIFGVKTTFDNSGIVSSLSHTVTDTSATKEAGKVSQPKNKETGTFKGNASTITIS